MRIVTVTHAVWLEPASVCKLLPVQALSFDGAVKENVCERHDNVVDDAATSDQAETMLVFAILIHDARQELT
jgi:hypothetical protein